MVTRGHDLEEKLNAESFWTHTGCVSSVWKSWVGGLLIDRWKKRVGLHGIDGPTSGIHYTPLYVARIAGAAQSGYICQAFEPVPR